MIPALGFILPILGNWQRIAIYAALIGMACLTIWMHGYFKGKQALYEYQAAQAQEATRIAGVREKVTTKTVIKYVEKQAKTETVIKEVEKEVTRYAEANPDGLCIDSEWGRLHNNAALNLSLPTGNPAGGLRAPGSSPSIKFPYRVPSPPDRNTELRETSSVR